MKTVTTQQTAEQQGYQAFVQGAEQVANPHVPHTADWFSWNEGYEQAFMDNEAELYGN